MSRASACHAGAVLSDDLIAQALTLGGVQATLEDLVKSPFCYLEGGHTGLHHGFVMELNRRGVWVAWSTATRPVLKKLSNCPAETQDGMDACGGFLGHRGAHGWQIHGPGDRASQEAVKAHLRPA